MPTYLDRYLGGEHARVWDELVALGERVREPAIYTDAVAVARETMHRTRANIDRIVERLRGMNFDFTHADRVFVPPAPGTADVLERLEQRIGPMLGFKRFDTAAATISGIELAAKIRKGQFKIGKLPGRPTTVPAIWAAVVTA